MPPRQPWRSAHEKDYAWLGQAVTRHYQGDESQLKELIGGVVQAFAGMTVEDYAAAAEAFLRDGRHPMLERRYCDCGYRPMVELLAYLEANGFTNYIASAGDRDFMRPVTREMYGIPPERVVGSSNALRYQETDEGGSVVYLDQPDYFDDGPAKPVRLWSRIGSRPIVAVGNSNGDIPMLRYTSHQSRPSLNLLVNHDDGDREFAYASGAEEALSQAAQHGWPVISIKNDWAEVFAT